MGYIDAHSHVWTDDLARYPPAPGETFDGVRPTRFTPEELLGHARGSGVDRVVLIQFSAHGFDNTYVLDAARAHPGVFSVVAVVDVTADRPDREMVRLAEKGVRGFRIRPGSGPMDSWLDGQGYERMFAAASERSLAICPLLNPNALPALARRVEQFPDAPVVIDHMARIGINEPVREEHIALLTSLARFPRVLVKISAFYAFGARRPPYEDVTPLARKLFDAFGPRRLMWGSDCPFQIVDHRYEESIAVVRDRLGFLSRDDKEWMLEKTAEATFFP